jgi:hypothetical protein
LHLPRIIRGAARRPALLSTEVRHVSCPIRETWVQSPAAASALCTGNKTKTIEPQTFASRAAVWCNALTSDEGLGLITPQTANRSGLRH